MCQNFWNTYGRVTEDDVKDNKDMLTVAWQPHQESEVRMAQIKTCLMYGHFSKKVIPAKDLIDTLLIVIQRMGSYQVRYNR